MGRRSSWGRIRLLFIRKLLAVVLTFSFSLSPLITFAQDVGSGTPPLDSGAGSTSVPGDTSTGTPAATPPPSFSIPGVGTGSDASSATAATPPAGLETSAGSNGASATTPASPTPPASPPSGPLSPSPPPPPTVQTPTVFTLQNERPKADGQSGALIQNLKLDIPPGRNGLQPDLALQYNSQRAEDGIAGYGWTVTIPYIQRLNKTGSQDLYNNPYFTSSIDGELATTSTGTTTQSFQAKVDEGSFNAYSFVNNVWTMYDKHGTRYTFGASDNAQQNASASSSQIYTWMLQEIRDQNNNYVRYIYAKDSGQIYPLKILYTGNGSTDGIFTIAFSTTTTRLDPYVSYKPLFKVTTNYKISQITAAVNGTVVRQYTLLYGAGNNGARSLLTSLQETGWDANGNNAVTLPAETFSYVNDSSAFMSRPSVGAIVSQTYVVADINGNSKPDITYAWFGTPNAAKTIAEGATYVDLPTPPGYWGTAANNCQNFTPNETGLRLVDVNADGKADYIQGSYDAGVPNVGASINTYSTSTGYAWGGSATGTIPYFEGSGVTTGIFGDVNGDGLPDFEMAVNSLGAPFGSYAYLGSGTLWDPATTTVFSPMQQMPTTVQTVTNSQLIDVNGDGLADWVYSDSGHTYVLLNTGNGWESTPDPHWTIATSTLYLVPASSPAKYLDRGIRFIDINGDGLPDMVRSFKNTAAANPNDEVADYNFVMLNTGYGWATTTYALSGYITQGDATAGQCYSEYATNWDGIGQNKQDVLSKITYSQGGTASISYVKSGASGNPELPISLLVVSKIITDDGFANTFEKDYTYSGGKIYTALGVRQQKFAGFSTSVESDANTNRKTYFDQGDAISTGNGEQNDGYGQIGHPYRIDTTNVADGKLLRTVFNRWDTATTSGGRVTFVFLARQVQQDYGASGAHRDTATDYTYDRTTGNVTQITHYGEVTGNSDGTFTDTGSDKSTETFLYAGQGTGSSTPQTITSSGIWTAPAGVSSVTVDMWGGGGGGSGGDSAQVGGGAGAYVHAANVPVTPNSAYTVTIGGGGGGGFGAGAVGAGGAGYATGGSGSSDTHGRGGGGGGSSAFTNDGGTVIAAGGGGGGYNSGTAGSGTSGGVGGDGNAGGTNFAGGGGAASTNGANASGHSGGAGGTGATSATGTGSNGGAVGGGGASAGSSGNGGSPSGTTGGTGSGGEVAPMRGTTGQLS
jgi:hypothetical protein